MAISAASRRTRRPPSLPSELEKAGLAAFLLGRAPAEDLAAYEPAMLERAAALAGSAVAKHKRGESVIAVDVDAGIVRDGRPVTVVTVVNDNMPFLFDSVLGEIGSSAGEPVLVTHPVIDVRHGKTGVEEILTESGGAGRAPRHSRPYPAPVRRGGGPTPRPAGGGASAGAGGGRRLEADASPPRSRDLGVSLRADTSRQGCGHRGDRLPRMVA
jgi:hypothetical protein